MNKEFSRKWVKQQAAKLDAWQKHVLTFGDLMEITQMVADDQLCLKDVMYELVMRASDATAYMASFEDEEQQRIYAEHYETHI